MSFSHYDATLILRALAMTITLSVAGAVTGTAIGTALALLRFSTHALLRPLRLLVMLYVGLVRRIPFLIVLYGVFFATGMAGIDISPPLVALAAISLIGGAYISQIVYNGLCNVDTTQIEAAETTNLRRGTILRHVILPAALPGIVPPVLGYLVLFVKDTALASQIGVIELNQASIILTNRGLPTYRIFVLVLCLYFLVSFPLTTLSRKMEKKLAASAT